MAEDRKPKIDLKSRLQKMGGPGAPAAAPPATSQPSVPPPFARSGPPSGAQLQGLPRPVASAPAPALDPNNPFSALGKPSIAPTHSPILAHAQPQRIEVDEEAISRARGGARK